MKLADWFKQRNPDGTRRSKGKFAAAIGKSASTLSGYIDGSVWPPREAMEAIERETAGDVTANDFVDAPAREMVPAEAAQ